MLEMAQVYDRTRQEEEEKIKLELKIRYESEIEQQTTELQQRLIG